MLPRVKWLAIGISLALLGCTNNFFPGTTGGGDTGGDQQADTGGDDTGTAAGLSLTGTIAAPQSGKWAPRAQASHADYTVLAQSDQTGEVYRATTDADGDFEVELPEAEQGNTFMVTVLGPDGRTVGPVLFGTAGDDGLTGLAPVGQTSLGLIELPEDPVVEPIAPGPDADLADLIDPSLTSRLGAGGVPVGLASHGKGDDALNETPDPGHKADADQDGLIDVFDADDDGDGIVDDFDTEGTDDSIPSDVHVNFFMNLKIAPQDAPTYYAGSNAEIETRLATDTIITFEVMMEPGATREITAAHLLETPGPAYLPNADKMTDGTGGLAYTNWADEGYAFDEEDDRFDAFVRPNDVMDAGDTFTVEISFDDGTTEQHTRMINYVFKNIPKLVQYGGSAGVRNAFDVTDAAVNGTPEHPIPFDGFQNLVLVFEPPVDETGAYLTGLDYAFEIFYETEDGTQLNGQIDQEATWATLPTGFEGQRYWVSADDLSLSASNTYTVTLPKEIFVDTVVLNTAEEVAVDHYKIDIAAQAPTGNAAIMLTFQKE